jgi:hypothetical protein
MTKEKGGSNCHKIARKASDDGILELEHFKNIADGRTHLSCYEKEKGGRVITV